MGFAQGRIFQERVHEFMTTLWDYFIDEITSDLGFPIPFPALNLYSTLDTLYQA